MSYTLSRDNLMHILKQWLDAQPGIDAHPQDVRYARVAEDHAPLLDKPYPQIVLSKFDETRSPGGKVVESESFRLVVHEREGQDGHNHLSTALVHHFINSHEHVEVVKHIDHVIEVLITRHTL